MSVPLDQIQWQRQDQPVLSAMTTRQKWCRVQCYSPTVVRVGDAYMMWFVGNRTATRTNDFEIGLARSDDGIRWTQHPDNPVLTGRDLPKDVGCSTPFVLHDPEGGRFRMWFQMSRFERDERGAAVAYDLGLGHAVSRDGVGWEVHPESLYPSAQGPCVLRDETGGFQMWMNSAPKPDTDYREVIRNIYRFESRDGIHWQRDPQPALTASEELPTVVYPFALRDARGYTMWFSSCTERFCEPLGGAVWDIYCATSDDGRTWRRPRRKPALAATRDPNDYDGRYVTAPCVVDGGDRYLMYYSCRDWGNLYGAGDGTIRFDRAGIYRHVGVAIGAKT